MHWLIVIVNCLFIAILSVQLLAHIHFISCIFRFCPLIASLWTDVVQVKVQLALHDFLQVFVVQQWSGSRLF